MNTTLHTLLDADAKRFTAFCTQALASARAALARFKALPADTPFLAVVDAWDAVGHDLNPAAGLASLFFQVHPEAKVREAAAQAEQELQRFTTELSLDRQAFERLVALAIPQDADPVARRIVEHALRDYRRAGVDRDEEVRTRVRALREELVTIAQEFSRNIASDVRSITVADGRDGLTGLPDDWIEAHRPGVEGAVTVTTNPTDYVPFMKYAARRDLRQALFFEYQNRGAPANLDVLQRMIARRHELAGLLGYPHWAAYVTEDKMIKTAEKAAAFIERVTQLTGERMEREARQLEELLLEEHPEARRVRDWDRMYLAELGRRRHCAFDTREARPYFPYAAVQQGVLDTAARLYGLQFVRAEVPLWHADVQAFDVREQGQLVARFYLDMHPREDKYKHAAMFDAVSGLAGRRVPEATLVCNFPRPDEDDPGLMEPGDVRTFFHEFGHLLHHLLAGRQRWLSVSGIATEWDFVEVPSQLFEEWADEAVVLQRFARHHQTGEPIPGELVARMRAAGEYGKGLNTRTQMFFAALSLECFRRDPAGLDTSALVAELKPRYVPFPLEEGTAFQASFGHLEGYSALYYTYMWSLVLAKDLLGAFGGNLLDEQVARRYREAILAPGGSRDAADLVRAFLGRPSSDAAFEAWLAA